MLIQPIKPASAALFQDILVVVMNTAEDEAAIGAADDLCSRMGGRATALLVSPFRNSYFVGDAYDGGAEMWATVLGELRRCAAEEGVRLRARIAKAGAPMEFRTIEREPLMSRQDVVMSARHADISMFTRPTGAEAPARVDLLEAALFDSGRPVLIVPPGYTKPMTFKNVLVAWNASREAARALGDAAPALRSAERVTLVTVDETPALMGPGQAPGEDIATHLAHRGVNVQLRNLDSAGRSEAKAILDAARDVNADLIVLGAYGHARMREFIFGGVTRELLQQSDVPLFMSH